MQVYEVIQDGQQAPDFFRNFADIKTTLEQTFCKLAHLKVDIVPSAKGPVRFIVTGTWPLDMGPDLGGKDVNEIFFATRYPVWDSPTHL